MGSYQRRQCLFLMLPVLDCAFHIMSFIFIGKFVPHKCANVSKWESTSSSGRLNFSHRIRNTSEDLSPRLLVTMGTCSITVTNQSEQIYHGACLNGYEYAEPVDRSFVSEWDLVCEKEALPDLSQTVMSLGMMCGAFLFTVLADKFGRKPTYVICHICLLSIALVIAFVPDFATFLVLRFLLGALQQGTALTSWILMLELLPTSKREWPSRVGVFVWPSGLLLLGLVCFLCRDLSWRYTELVLASFSCYSLIQWWLVDESIRWFTVNGKTSKAEQIIAKAAKKNRVDTVEVLGKYRSAGYDLSLTVNPKETAHVQIDGLSVKRPSVVTAPSQPPGRDQIFSAFVKNKHILKLIVIICFMWFTDSLAYMTLIFTSQSLTDDFYQGYILNVLVELPAGFVFSIFINRIGRRYCAIAAHQISGVALLVLVLLANIPAAAGIPGIHILFIVSSLVAKFGVTLGFAVLWLYTPELFPTTIRTTAFGLASLVSRVAGMVAPYSRTISRHFPWAPGATLSVLCLGVSVLVKFLPETQGHDLPQTVAEMELWLQDSQGRRAEGTRVGDAAHNTQANGATENTRTGGAAENQAFEEEKF
ncbi:hypothetical protein EGW08_015607 [Elysia chlorotica]|uniref:Major facilitator superfamily (MFS) profile domain-containing protein n=1 Tax=Elysia chlorotica TaxID=188477 RepID=A0A433T524_ELYCH|nr:hypothetical protein EGW08_015607 [Elysia chlorotica]